VSYIPKTAWVIGLGLAMAIGALTAIVVTLWRGR
jgi:hypothetical protein